MTSPNVQTDTSSELDLTKPAPRREVKRRKTSINKVLGSPENFIRVYNLSLPVEREIGSEYYVRQRAKMMIRVNKSKTGNTTNFTLPQVVGAFVVLSPNNAESTNYRALDICIQIVLGILPESTKVPAYGLNKQKALAILRGDNDPLNIVKGQKVTAFYHNTLNPDNSDHLTIDGHMLGCWMGKRIQLRGEGDIPAMEYELICSHLKLAATWTPYTPLQLQAILWLTWKRLHNILPYDPQLSLDWEGEEYAIQSIINSRNPEHESRVNRYLADQFRSSIPAIL